MGNKAWLLSETTVRGKERIVGIALTNEAASAWVRRNNVEGEKRTSLPYPIIELPAAPPPTGGQPPQEPR